MDQNCIPEDSGETSNQVCGVTKHMKHGAYSNEFKTKESLQIHLEIYCGEHPKHVCPMHVKLFGSSDSLKIKHIADHVRQKGKKPP